MPGFKRRWTIAKLKKRLNELLREKKDRSETMAMAMNQTPGSQEKKEAAPKEKTPPESWEEKRKDWLEKYKKNLGLEAPAGEIANMIDGLSPDGYDKKGRRASFVERGKSFTGSQGISGVFRE